MLLPQVEVGVYITGDLLIALRMDDLLKLLGDEVVEGVYVLLDQASDLQEGWKKLIFILQLLDRLCQLRGI